MMDDGKVHFYQFPDFIYFLNTYQLRIVQQTTKKWEYYI